MAIAYSSKNFTDFEKQNDYAGKIFNQINEAHIRVKLDNNNESL